MGTVTGWTAFFSLRTQSDSIDAHGAACKARSDRHSSKQTKGESVMEIQKRVYKKLMLALLAAIVIAAVAGGAFAAAGPPTVTMAVTGDPVPGATVTAKATITINDGSTLQSIKWTQVGGVPATL